MTISRDSGESDFWLKKWSEGDIGFHQNHVHAYLEKFWPGLQATQNVSVFVPLCGKSLDMKYLLDRGCKVLGVEISETAILDFFHEQRIQYDITRQYGIRGYAGENVVLWAADYFNLPEHMFSSVSTVYDRAALIALPPDVREAYVQKMRGLLAGGVRILMITLEYEQGQIEAPPYSVNVKELKKLFGDWCSIDHLETHYTLVKREQVLEHAYRLTACDMQER